MKLRNSEDKCLNCLVYLEFEKMFREQEQKITKLSELNEKQYKTIVELEISKYLNCELPIDKNNPLSLSNINYN